MILLRPHLQKRLLLINHRSHLRIRDVGVRCFAVNHPGRKLQAQQSSIIMDTSAVAAPSAIPKVYSQLAKARLSALVVMSSSAGFMLAGAPIAVDALAAVTVGTALQAAAANTFNQLYEIRTDSLMNRTKARPLPAGKISKQHAFGFGAANALVGTAVLANFCNPLTAALGGFNVFLYSCIYTPMKQKSIYNTWVGAVVGAIPPLMGYAAATGTVASAEAGILSAGLFLWQFPHFFSLAWLSKKDYIAGGHKMVPCFDKTGVATSKLLIKYSLGLSTLPILSYSMGITSAMFPLESIAFNGYLLYSCYNFKNSPSMSNARRVFRTSLWYLPLFMTLMIFHKNEWSDPNGGASLALSSGIVASESSRKPPVVLGEDIESPKTLEGALRCAKALMKRACVHEIMAPPLTRTTEEKSEVMCPVTQASKAFTPSQ